MQWVALEENNRITAGKAVKSAQYLCPECFCPVRMRSGPHRRPHYYHVSKNSLCRQQGKTAFHFETQLAILKALPKDEAILEFSFPSIHRIADVYWATKNIVFEVQCSNISYKEVKKRTEDYASLGLHVIWILHDRRYNKMRLSSAELFLTEHQCYYTSIDAKGVGSIYDQFNVISGAKRVFKGIKMPIEISSPYEMKQILCSADWPKDALSRKNLRSIGFQGDLVDRVFNSSATTWESMRFLELRKRDPLAKKIKAGWFFLKGIYSSLLHAFLEKNAI